MNGLRAVTFDYWRTLVWESPGDLERVRLQHWTRLLAHRVAPPRAHELAAAHAAAFARATTCWRSNVQYRAEHAAELMIDHLGLEVTERERHELADAFSEAGKETPLRLAPGIGEALQSLKAQGIRLGIVCDVGLTPSPVLREHLHRFGLLELFDHWSFSDEVGSYKPAVEPFRHACAGLGVQPSEAAHVGDQRRTDVVGAQRAGVVAVRYTGVFDDTDARYPPGDIVIPNHLHLWSRLSPFQQRRKSGGSNGP